MAKIEWTPLAVQDLESIFEYISKDSVFYAARQVDRLVNRVDVLESFPASGKIVPEFNDESIRELLEGNYRIVYKVTSETIFIARVHHSAKNLT